LNTEDDLLPQWIQSQNGSEFCQYNHLPKEIRLQLRQEDKFTLTMMMVFDTQSNITMESGGGRI
jgi:hypothetical protein